MKEQVQLHVQSKMENLSLVLNFIENRMHEFGMGERDLFQTQIAVDEAVTNIMEHGELGNKNEIILKCEKKGDEVEIIIEDEGKPFDPTTMPEPDITSPLEKRKSGGLGVYFIKTYMNQVKYDYIEGKNVLTLIKYLKR